MTLFTRIMAFYFAAAIGFFMLGIQTPFTALATSSVDFNTAVQAVLASLPVAVAAIAASSIFAGSITPMIVFADIAATLASSFFTYPIMLLGTSGIAAGSPVADLLPVLNLIFIFMQFLFVTAVIYFARGDAA